MIKNFIHYFLCLFGIHSYVVTRFCKGRIGNLRILAEAERVCMYCKKHQVNTTPTLYDEDRSRIDCHWVTVPSEYTEED